MVYYGKLLGKEDGNYCITIGYILGLYEDNGKENGHHYVIIGAVIASVVVDVHLPCRSYHGRMAAFGVCSDIRNGSLH